ncbi:LOG family protein [Siccirubricoccus phaeus]|uniref:LOG family protein n=1 Tax=Siccirubricoccus phaeus TaxID=2595053 RepID=UPI0011F2CD28|nr:LOG family protein [Siccirubricoccus phaeus]
MNIPQHDSPSYRLAVEDTEFLLRDEMRAFRFGMEYAKAELLLRDWGVRSTVVVFGSARIPAPEAVQAGTKLAHLAPWYEVAREFGRLVSERGGALAPERHGDRSLRDNVVATGGGPGIMEAANRGAAEAGAPSIGFNIVLPHEQMPNRYSTPELTFRFHYFAMRKMHLAMRANALAVFPGGFGTFDELFEILTLLQTKKAPPVGVVLFGREYWTEVVNFQALRRHGLVDAADLDLFGLVDTAEEGWEWLTAHGLHAHTPPAEAPPADTIG